MTFLIDAAISWATREAQPDGGARVVVRHGTGETPARLTELGGRFVQLRLEAELVVARGDRLVIGAPTPGDGVVLDPAPARHGPSRDLLARLAGIERELRQAGGRAAAEEDARSARGGSAGASTSARL
jgi:selenocysteine-specific elongation factor